jgi:hypothetical protein
MESSEVHLRVSRNSLSDTGYKRQDFDFSFIYIGFHWEIAVRLVSLPDARRTKFLTRIWWSKNSQRLRWDENATDLRSPHLVIVAAERLSDLLPDFCIPDENCIVIGARDDVSAVGENATDVTRLSWPRSTH